MRELIERLELLSEATFARDKEARDKARAFHKALSSYVEKNKDNLKKISGGGSGMGGFVIEARRFWSGEGAMERAAHYGRTLEKTPIGAVLNKLGDKVPYAVWKTASATFAANARSAVLKVGIKQGNIWRTIEKPILNWRKIPIKQVP